MSEILKEGDSDPCVAEVRTALARLGLLPEFSDDIGSNQMVSEEDNFFDSALALAVRTFQQKMGLIANGNINEATLRRVREGSFQLGARVLSFQPTNEHIGDDVAALQDHLREMGFYHHRVDGHFGKVTDSAVREYQMNMGLNVDGICGPKVLRSLERLGKKVTGGNPQLMRENENVRSAGPRLTGKRVVIDCSRGGEDKGMTVSGRFGTITEEELLWDLATRLEGRMVAAGMEAIMSRPKQGSASRMERAQVANAFDAHLVVSLHADRYPNEKASGCSSFYFGIPGGDYSMIGQKLADFIQREITARTNLVNCRHHARSWELLRFTSMPTVEVFVGYLTSPTDVAILTDPAQRDAIADAIVVAVKRLYLMDDDDQPTGTFKFRELIEQEMM